MNFSGLSEEEIQQIQQKQLAIIQNSAAKRSEKDVQLLMYATENISFFKSYSNDPSFKYIHKQCCMSMEYEFVKKGDWVFEIDSIGEKFYLILKGSVSVWIYPPGEAIKNKDNLIQAKQLRYGESFGELSLISKKPRLASIKADEDCHFAILEAQPFKQILQDSENEKLLKEMGFFADLPLFQTWNFNLIKQIYLNSIKKQYKRGERVFSQGDNPDKIFIVSSGQYTIFKEIGIDCIGDEKYIMKPEDELFKQLEGNNLKLNRPPQKKLHQIINLAAHELFGEEDILNKESHRTFTVVCQEEGLLLEISKNDLIQRICSQRCSHEYLQERLKIKQNLMKERLEVVTEQLKVNTYNKYEDTFQKMIVKSPLKQKIKDMLYNNEDSLNNGGIFHRKFNQEELKKYNKKFDEELEKRRLEEQKKPEFLNSSAKLFIHKLQYQFDSKLGSDKRMKQLKDHVKHSSVIELIPANLGSVPTLRELREEYEEELPKVVNKATLNYFMKKLNKIKQKSASQVEANLMSNIKSLNQIPQQIENIDKKQYKTFSNFKRNLLDDSNFKIEEETLKLPKKSFVEPTIKSLNFLQCMQDDQSLSKNTSRDSITEKSEQNLFLTDNKSVKDQKQNQAQEQSFLVNRQIKQFNQYSKQHQNIIKLLNETQAQQPDIQQSDNSQRNSRKLSAQSIILDDDSQKILFNQQLDYAHIAKVRATKSSSQLQRAKKTQFQFNLRPNFSFKKNQYFLSSAQSTRNKNSDNNLIHTISYQTPSLINQNISNSPLQLPIKNNSLKITEELQKSTQKEQLKDNSSIFQQKDSKKFQLNSFSTKFLQNKQQIQSDNNLNQKPITNFIITNSNKKIQNNLSTSPNKKKRIIYI
ncbi:cyclic nucleotide-binding domain protein (macronuclear) [Tetrahymena thermophila SB210]|uniref:Cyclic nucleotide-binding domain protein n=1 Tax=Tetrahymena thermophila (strain SB210) TaxID=312017 RepID=Q23WM4_TETTS|nr:cyclic nucleotide-binding domain protein [Tetrahymena thermophila SB210]EAS00956.1 cyclic nucleotide-binding domain protein [Tetrahymena thermophila SB210]|eukprot:XP_001021201.1 cyclic nucleotide-binding domain protein [Tetrahymena thermophila SB210]